MLRPPMQAEDAGRQRVHIQMNPFSALVLATSVAALLLVAATACCTAIKHDRIGRIAQVEFVLLLLAGIFSVCVGSLLMALRPTELTCVVTTWLVVIGYALQVAPLVVKASAIVWIVAQSRKMRRVDVDKKKMFGGAVGLTTVAALYCSLWTTYDPPRVRRDEDAYHQYYGCESSSHAWIFAFFACQGLGNIRLLYLAFGLREAPKGIGESDEIEAMIYVSSIFLIFRASIYVVSIEVSAGPLAKFTLLGLFYAMEMICNIFIYFPQFLREDFGRIRNTLMGSRWGSQSSIPMGSQLKPSGNLNRSTSDTSRWRHDFQTSSRMGSNVSENAPYAGDGRRCAEENGKESPLFSSAGTRVRFHGLDEEEGSETPKRQSRTPPGGERNENSNSDFGSSDGRCHASQQEIEARSGASVSEHISRYDFSSDIQTESQEHNASDDRVLPINVPSNNESRQ